MKFATDTDHCLPKRLGETEIRCETCFRDTLWTKVGQLRQVAVVSGRPSELIYKWTEWIAVKKNVSKQGRGGKEAMRPCEINAARRGETHRVQLTAKLKATRARGALGQKKRRLAVIG